MVYGNCDVAVKRKLKFRSNKTANQCLEAPRDASVHAGCSGVSALQLPGKKQTNPKTSPQPSVRKSNPDIVQSAETILSPKILVLT